ncbi:MAG: acetoacetate decarboxylase family protein [Halothece sp.]
MVYPQAPWQLKGYAIQTLQLVDVDQVRPLIPAELSVVSVFPGKTLGGIYLSSYGAGSTLEYNELIVIAAIARYQDKTGSWVSHLYVDDSDSLAGGREIWGLPKEIASFTWEKDSTPLAKYSDRVTVRQGTATLCRLSFNQPQLKLPIPFKMGSFGLQSANILFFNSEFKGDLGLTNSEVDLPPESPFSQLNLDQPWLSIYSPQFNFVANAPMGIGQKAAEFVYQ